MKVWKSYTGQVLGKVVGHHLKAEATILVNLSVLEKGTDTGH